MPTKGKVTSNLEIEKAQLIFRNFSGRASDFNPEGFRKFSVIIEDDTAQMLLNDGWNIKKTRGNEDEGDPGVHFLTVDVTFDRYPAQVTLISNGVKSMMDQSTIGLLDSADIEACDLVIRPYNWGDWDKKGARHGVKAFLKVGYFTIIPDKFAEKYRNVPMSGSVSQDDLPFEPD